MKMIAKEGTNFTYKLAICAIMMAALIISSFLRGAAPTPSIIGVTRCSDGDIAILVLLIVFGI